MPNSNSTEHGWMLWSNDSAVEYQIADGFLRIRHWQDGQLKTSVWHRWEHSTDATIRRLQRAIAWSELPKHRKDRKPVEKRARLRDHLRSWLRDHLLPSSSQHWNLRRSCLHRLATFALRPPRTAAPGPDEQ